MNGAVARTLAIAVVIILVVVTVTAAGASLSGALAGATHSSPSPSPFPGRGGPNIPPPVTGPQGSSNQRISWNGPKSITTPVSYSNATIELSGGNLTIEAGGSLTFDNVTLIISQAASGRVSALTYGISVLSGGTFDAKFSAIQSGNGSLDPTYLVIAGGGRYSHDRFTYFGGAGSSPVTGKEGIYVECGGISFLEDAFDHVYQLLFSGALARSETVEGSLFTNSTLTGGSVGWVQVSGGSSWVSVTGSLFYGWSDAGLLISISGPHVTLQGNGFIGDSAGTQPSQVLVTYNGYSDTGLDGSFAQILGNWLQTANIGVVDSSYVTIEDNWINDTGLWSGVAGNAAILVDTWIGSGVGLYTRHLAILDNSISNFTHYGIRVTQNVSDFNISGNRLFNTVSEYSTAITEGDGIYLIRQVNNGTVFDNTLDMTDAVQPSEPVNGIVLESRVNDVNVTDNRVYNCSEVGITVQGDDDAVSEPAYFVGGSFGDVLYKNDIVNDHSMASQTLYSTEAIETWMWANGTKIVDNVIEGWTAVNLGQYYNGAGLYTSSSDQLVAGNVFSNVRYGFIFSVFAPAWEQKAYGSFNRSYNTLENNSVTGVGEYTLVENALDGMGPIVNILRGTLNPSWSLWFSGSNATLRVINGYLPSLSSGSPYAASNVEFYPVLHLEEPNATDALSALTWADGQAVVAYSAFESAAPISTAVDDLTVVSYTPSTDAVTWTIDDALGGTTQFDFSAVVPGGEYSFALNGVVLARYNVTVPYLAIPLAFTGSYRFSLTEIHGGSSPAPIDVSISPSFTSGFAPLADQFQSTVTGGSGSYSYNWSFGDGTFSTLSDPLHVYSASGSYTAQLTVTDSTGAHAWANVSVMVSPTPSDGGTGSGSGGSGGSGGTSGTGGAGGTGGGGALPPLQSPPKAFLRDLSGAALGFALFVPAIYYWVRREFP
jgi:hypothetical protein